MPYSANTIRSVRIAFLALSVALASIPHARAQSVPVQMEVDVDSWLGDVPFDVASELTAKLRDANIEVTDRSDVPLVVFEYVEEAAPGYVPRLVPSTRIDFRVDVKTDRGSCMAGGPISLQLPPPGDHFPSAVELRRMAFEAFRVDHRVLLAGHFVGACLGLEPSFRALMASPADRPSAEMLIFSRLSWSPDVDDLFEQAINNFSARRPLSTTLLETFLMKQMELIKTRNRAAVGSTLAALKGIGDRGSASAIPVLNAITSSDGDPAILAAANTALAQATARQPAQ